MGVADRLHELRRLDSPQIVAEFEVALEGLPDDLDLQALDELLTVFDDGTESRETMFALLHRIERAPIELLVEAIVRALPSLIRTAPWWCRVFVIRILNNERTRSILIDVETKATVVEQRALMDVLRDIQRSTNPVGATATQVLSTLGGR